MKWLLETIFPKTCYRCLSEGHYICYPAGRPEPIREYLAQSGDLDSILAFDRYRAGGLSQAIHAMKYHSIKGIAEELGHWLGEQFGPEIDRGALIVPVPLHKKRLRHRGFNQAQVIAESIDSQLNVFEALERSAPTVSQVLLPRPERLTNLTNAFRLKVPPEAVKDTIIYLVDDVATTGSTLAVCARVLKRAGARKIIGLVVARD